MICYVSHILLVGETARKLIILKHLKPFLLGERRKKNETRRQLHVYGMRKDEVLAENVGVTRAIVVYMLVHAHPVLL